MNGSTSYPFNIRKSSLVALLAMAVSLTIPLLISGKDLLATLLQIPPSFIFIIIGVAFLQFMINAMRVKVALRMNTIQAELKGILKLLFAVEAAIQLTPASSGGLPAAILMTRHLKLSPAIVTSITIFLGFLDGIVIIGICGAAILAGLALQHASSQLTAYSILILIIMITVFSLFVIAVFFTPKMKKCTLHLFARITGRKSFKVARFWLQTEKQIHQMSTFSAKHLALLGGLSLAYWLCRLSMLFTTVLIVGESVSWPHSALIQIAGGVVGLFSGLPAGLIGADLTQAALLALFMNIDKAAAALMLWRFGTFHLVILVGLPILLTGVYRSLNTTPATMKRGR